MAAPKGNKYAEGNDGGRPPMYETPEEMQKIIEEYFTACEVEGGDFPTISGLAYALGFTTQALRDYEKKDEFLCTIKSAKQKVEMAWEQRLLTPGSGPIFWLKNNANWKDKQETEHTGNLIVQVMKFTDADNTDSE